MFKMTNVIGVKKVEEAFGRIFNGFKPSVRADILMVGAEVIAEGARDNILDRGLVKEGTLYDSVKAYKVNQWAAGVRVDAAHGAVHEFGLENQPITEKQRRFFWAMWAQTGDEMWKALALSVTYTIPARPYLRPAVVEKKGEAALAIMQEMASYMTRLAGIGGSE